MPKPTVTLDKDELHKVMQGDVLVGIKGSVVIKDAALGERRMRFTMQGEPLTEWWVATAKGKRKALLRKYVKDQVLRTMKKWKEEPPIKRGVPMDASEIGEDLS